MRVHTRTHINMRINMNLCMHVHSRHVCIEIDVQKGVCNNQHTSVTTGQILTVNPEIYQTENIGENNEEAVQKNDDPFQCLHLVPVHSCCSVLQRGVFQCVLQCANVPLERACNSHLPIPDGDMSTRILQYTARRCTTLQNNLT